MRALTMIQELRYQTYRVYEYQNREAFHATLELLDSLGAEIHELASQIHRCRSRVRTLEHARARPPVDTPKDLILTPEGI